MGKPRGNRRVTPDRPKADVPRLAGFQKPLDDGKRKQVRVAVISQGDTAAQCSCGAAFTQQRAKVREAAIQAHLDKKHGGTGLWL